MFSLISCFCRCESEGIRLLRSLLSMSPVALGHTFPRRVLTGQHGEETVSFELTGVLGRGGFATAFQAAIVGLPDHSSVVIKAATTTSISLRHNHDDQLHHMSKELNVLRTLNHSATDPNHSSSSYSSTSTAHVRNLNLFPKLIFPEWQCTTKQLFLAMSPVGIPLILYASRLNKYDRSIQVIKLRNQLLEALATANTIGYCHCDLRPDNVIFDSRSELFVIIDWGLGCKPEEAFHKYFGRLPFFHDDIVLSAGSSSPIPYLHKYDVASVHYVAFAFTLGMKQLSVPWIDSMGEKLVNLRKEYVSCDW